MTTARDHRPRPRESAERCALRSQIRGDTMVGTAIPAARLLLVEQPGPWGRRGLRDSRFDADVAARLEAAAGRHGVRVQAIRRPGRTPAGLRRVWALADTRDGAESLRWGDFAADADLLELDLDGAPGVADTAPLYLVCAHSKHDTCCALRGRPVAAALDELRPGRVWETSHLGGDRFAANVLVLPVGLQYGRVLPFAAREFVAAADAGEVVGPLLRGRIGVPPASQAALAFAHDQLALRRRQDIRLVGVTADGSDTVAVRLDTVHGQVDVLVQVETVPVTGLTCANPNPGTYQRYRPVLLRPLD